MMLASDADRQQTSNNGVREGRNIFLGNHVDAVVDATDQSAEAGYKASLLMADSATRFLLPLILEREKFNDLADELETLEPITDSTTLRHAQNTLLHSRDSIRDDPVGEINDVRFALNIARVAVNINLGKIISQLADPNESAQNYSRLARKAGDTAKDQDVLGKIVIPNLAEVIAVSIPKDPISQVLGRTNNAVAEALDRRVA